jgi:hypothetical protein
LADSEFIARAIVTYEAARAAKVRWLPGVCLVPEVARLAGSMGYRPDEIARVGELTEDLQADGVVFLRGSVVILDEEGFPSGLFGWDLPGAVDRLTRRCT